LRSGKSLGYDIVVLTNNSPVLDKVIHTDGWAIPLDQRVMQQNFYPNATPFVKNPTWDPGNKYTMAWQSGLTAIGYDKSKTGRDITTVQDLFDPAFKGHVGMFSDPQELGTLGLLAIGVEPASSTPADWQKAANKLMTQRPLVRNYYGQDYIDALSSGDIWITQAWSGDIFQTNKSLGTNQLSMAVPQEGGMLWTDNMLIPLYAEHPKDAMTYMDFVYRPDEGGLIADAVTYITPVAAAQDYILNTLHDPAAAHSPLIFPDTATAAKFKTYYIYKDQADLQQWNSIFEPIATG
jgi:spermidine/putrescine transport system substrate-binding protein